MKGIAAVVKLVLLAAFVQYLKLQSPQTHILTLLRPPQDPLLASNLNAASDLNIAKEFVAAEIHEHHLQNHHAAAPVTEDSEQDAVIDAVAPSVVSEASADQTQPSLVSSVCTLAIIKPDAVKSDAVHDILYAMVEAGLKVAVRKRQTLENTQVADFYAEHREKVFYQALISFMTESESIAYVLKGEDAVKKWRAAMGPTNPETARQTHPQSIRALYGSDVTRNAVHGSDSNFSAKREIGLIFGEDVYLSNCA
eukprot:TRINITY_DN1540_c0_g3_i1.p1 TRINITY_DN1540_c0_g3~~TRINITY_DN1540_c0_g3_i1.p1  ORF type:complete len:253 (+),score=64.60 TRINITY_DN1540_c0_g3_i1:61-819(+)